MTINEWDLSNLFREWDFIGIVWTLYSCKPALGFPPVYWFSRHLLTTFYNTLLVLKHTFTLLCLFFILLVLKTHFEVCYDHSCGKPTVDSVASCWGVFTFDWNVNNVCLFHLFVMPVCFLNLSVCCIFRFVCCIYSLAAFLDAKASLHLPMSI